jgi:tetratricopeptide (TPR) repeat protein
MTIWKEMLAILSRYEDSEEQRDELRRLVAMMPPDVMSVAEVEREDAQDVGAKTLYYLGELDRVLAWAMPPLTSAVKRWIGFTLFDLERYDEALPYFTRALKELDFQAWARTKVNELVLCCRIHVEPGTLNLDHFAALHAEYESLAEDAPVPVELHRALAYAEESGALPGTLITQARELFMDTFREWRLDKK